MCMVNGPVKTIGATKIFTAPSEDGTRQLTVYSNKVDSPADNAMVLPVPFPDSVQLHDFSAYSKLFNDLDSCFAQVKSKTLSANFSAAAGARGPLAVFRVGSYDASIVPSVSDFDRLDARVFTLNPSLGQVLRQNYGTIQGTPVGFIVCKLRSGAHTYHPFAYSHARPNNRLFVPTRHFHPHDGSRFFHADGDDWDHVVYTVNTDLSAGGRPFTNTTSVKWHQLPAEYRHCSGQRLVRWEFDGTRTNEDLQPVCTYLPPIRATVSTAAASSAPTSTPRVISLWSYITSFVGW
jgi:hypothetical protein